MRRSELDTTDIIELSEKTARAASGLFSPPAQAG
jgi:hypothetical protein